MTTTTTTTKKVSLPNKTQTRPKIGDKTKSLKDTASEIDDLFSVLSTAKKSKVDPAEEKKSKSDEVTLSDLEGLEEEEDGEADEADEEECTYYSGCSDDEISGTESALEEAKKVVKGVMYDPKRDDDFPAAPKAEVGATDDFFDSRGLKRKTRSLTEDGLPIFTPKELKIGLGGGTDLCPFDCNCCF